MLKVQDIERVEKDLQGDKYARKRLVDVELLASFCADWRELRAQVAALMKEQNGLKGDVRDLIKGQKALTDALKDTYLSEHGEENDKTKELLNVVFKGVDHAT